MLRKFVGFTRNGKPQLHADSRFQYFHNYWQVAQPKDTDIFFDEVRLESHRSLLAKVENQIKYNFASSRSRVDYLLFSHELFNENNIIAKDTEIQRLIHEMSTNYSVGGTPANKTSNRSRVLSEFTKIRKKILGRNYSIRLANHLVKVLSANMPLSNQVKKDIRFLVSAYIAELFYRGYDKDYISKIPDIITFSSRQFKFPYEKGIEDFGFDKSQFNSYITEEEKKDKTLARCFSGLINLMSRPFQNGYFVFKVNDIYLFDPHPIKVGDVEFYNPQKERKLHISAIDVEMKEHFIDVEDFRNRQDKENNYRPSKCNVIIPTEYVGPDKVVTKEAINYAFYKAVRSLDILNEMMHRSGRGGVGNGKISFHRHFRLHNNYRLAYTGMDIFDEKGRRIDFVNDQIDEIIREELEQEIKDIADIDLSTEFGSNLLHVMSIHSKFSNNQEMFNFKDLWIAWESIAPKDFTPPEDFMKKFAKAVFRYHYKKHYLIMTKGFLYINLSRFPWNNSDHFWSLSSVEIINTGLEVAPGKIITTSKFKRNFRMINSLVQNEIVQDVIARVNEFVNTPTQFFAKLDTWVDNLVDEIYIERNMEVHKNLTNDLSKIKLRDDFLKMSKWMAYMMARFTDKRSPENLDRIHERILAATSKLKI